MNLKNRIIVSFGIAFFLTITLFFIYSGEDKMKTLNTISLDEWKNLYDNNKDYIILDVRTPEEFNEGHIENAINVNFYDTNFKEQLMELSKDKKYLIYCRSGARSFKTLSLMNELEFNTVYDLESGILAWNNKGLEIEK